MKKRLKEAYETYLQGKIDDVSLDQRLQSYLGILSHANQHLLSQAIKNAYWIRKPNVIKVAPSILRSAKPRPKNQVPLPKTKQPRTNDLRTSAGPQRQRRRRHRSDALTWRPDGAKPPTTT